MHFSGQKFTNLWVINSNNPPVRHVINMESVLMDGLAWPVNRKTWGGGRDGYRENYCRQVFYLKLAMVGSLYMSNLSQQEDMEEEARMATGRTPVDMYFTWNLLWLGHFIPSNLYCTRFQNLNIPHLVLQLSLTNQLKPGVKFRMKM